MQAEKYEILDAHQRWVDEITRLPLLMRLADYMLASAYVQLGTAHATEILTYFDNPAKTRVS